MGATALIALVQGTPDAIVGLYLRGSNIKEEEIVTSPTKLNLLQNPIKGDFIELLLASPEHIEAEIVLYNQIGQKLRTYQFNARKSEENKLRLDSKGLPTGIYFLKLTTEKYTETKKLIKIR